MVQVKDQAIKTEEMREIQVWEHSEFSRELKPADSDNLHTCLAYAKLDLLSELMFMVQCSVGTRGFKADSTSLLASLEDISVLILSIQTEALKLIGNTVPDDYIFLFLPGGITSRTD